MRKTKGWLLTLAAAALGLLLAIRLAALLRMLLWAGVVAYLLLPLARLWEKRLPGGPAAVLSLVTVLALATGLGAVLAPGLLRQGRELVDALPELAEWLRQRLAALEAWCRGRLGLELGLSASLLGERLGRGLAEWAMALPRGDGSWAAGLLVPLMAVYLLQDRARLYRGLLYLLPSAWRADGMRILEGVHRSLREYLRGQLWVTLFVGVLTGLGLFLAGVPYALTLGLVMMLCNLLPYFGPFLGALPIAAVAAAAGGRRFLGAMAVVITVQQLENTVISPRVLGSRIRMSPLAVICAVLAGGLLAGTGGMLFALPVVMALREVARYGMDRITLNVKE